MNVQPIEARQEDSSAHCHLPTDFGPDGREAPKAGRPIQTVLFTRR